MSKNKRMYSKRWHARNLFKDARSKNNRLCFTGIFYTFNGSMKLLIDRTFAIEKTIHDKDFYLLTTGLALEESYFRIIKDTFQKYIDCLRVGGNRFVDYVLGFKTGNKDDIEKTDVLEKAYNMAKEIKINEQKFNSLFFT